MQSSFLKDGPPLYLFLFLCLIRRKGKECATLVSGFSSFFFFQFYLKLKQTNVTRGKCQGNTESRVTGRIIATCGSAFGCLISEVVYVCVSLCVGGATVGMMQLWLHTQR